APADRRFRPRRLRLPPGATGAAHRDRRLRGRPHVPAARAVTACLAGTAGAAAPVARQPAGKDRLAPRLPSRAVAVGGGVPLWRQRLVLAAAHGERRIRGARPPSPEPRLPPRAIAPGVAPAGRWPADLLTRSRARRPSSLPASRTSGRLRATFRDDPPAPRHGDFGAVHPYSAGGDQALVPPRAPGCTRRRPQGGPVPRSGCGHAGYRTGTDSASAVQGWRTRRCRGVRAGCAPRTETHPRCAGPGGDPGSPGHAVLCCRAARTAVRTHAQIRLANGLRSFGRARAAPGTDRTGLLSTTSAGRHGPSDPQPAHPGPLHPLVGPVAGGACTGR